ncbi:sigma-70 family RNA polymerase sigma factor [Spiractinospora alimapuensis]|nr:sigma-70 family RNA polymerase sigma factor [Spiractinospora alimapuensis]
MEHLVAATRDDVRRFIATLTDPGHSEELTQETFVRALRGLPRYAGQSSVLSWLFAIARHTVVDRYRSTAARPTEVAVTDWESVPRTPAACGRFDELLALTDLVRHLAPDRRDAFVATQVQGYTYAEVAQATGLPIGTVRSRVARARAELAASVRAAEEAA